MRSSRSRTLAALQHSLRSPRVLVTVGVLITGVVLAPAAAADPQARPAIPASDGLLADPGDPTTADEAQAAWIEASEAAESMNEKVLVSIDAENKARVRVQTAARTVSSKEQTLRTARSATDAAVAAAAAAGKKLHVAAAAESSYQDKVDQFTDASFRGARLGSMSAMFTADSPEDFLETASTLDVVADDTAQTLDKAAAAKAAATQARTEAQQAAAGAATARTAADAALKDADAAKADADAALTASHQATEQVRAQQAKLKSEAGRLQALQDRLSEQERQAALAAQAAAARQAAAAAEAQARADRNRAAAAAAPAAPAPGVAASPAAPAPGVAAAPAADGTSSTTAAAAETPAPAQAAGAPSGAAQAAVQAALSKVGSPYVFGAAGPSSFDCSGLTSWAYAQAGITIPRTSGGQAGLQYVPLDQLRPGDLITYYSPVHHVAMYIGDGQIVHASTSSKPVYVTTMYYGGDNPTGHRVVG